MSSVRQPHKTPERVEGYPVHYFTATILGPAAGSTFVAQLARPGRAFEIVEHRIETGADIVLNAGSPTPFLLGSGTAGATAVSTISNETAGITAAAGASGSLANALRDAGDQIRLTITNPAGAVDLSGTHITAIVGVQWR